MIAGMKHAEHIARAKHRGDGVEAARERLADDDHVGPHTVVLIREEPAGAAEA